MIVFFDILMMKKQLREMSVSSENRNLKKLRFLADRFKYILPDSFKIILPDSFKKNILADCFKNILPDSFKNILPKLGVWGLVLVSIWSGLAPGLVVAKNEE